MSRIDDLIQEFCPEGVPFLPLYQVTILGAGDRVTKADMTSSGRFPAYGAGTIPTGRLDVWNRKHSVLISRAGAGAGYVNFVETEFWATDVCFVAEQKASGPLIKFVYLWLKSNQSELMRHTYGGSMPKIDKLYLWRHPVPIPPLEVQREIVSTLDKFTQLEAELEAELEARRLQYEETRNNLLDFDQDLSSHPLSGMLRESCPEGVLLLPLTSVAKIDRGLTYQKTDEDPSGDVLVLRANNIDQRSNTIDMSDVKRLRSGFPAKPLTKLSVGDILLTAASGSRAHVGKVAYVFEYINAHFGGFMMALRSSNQVEGRYLFHILTSSYFRDYLDAALSTSTINNINSTILAGFRLPVPPLEIQREIVSILDKLDALVNDISFGLPAEIEARRKQYEYYRNKLLTFKELDAA